MYIFSIVIQIRDFLFQSSYNIDNDSEVPCKFKRCFILRQGHKKYKCINIYYTRKFDVDNQCCPTNCRGKRLDISKQDLDEMEKTDILYVPKKVIILLTTIPGFIVTMLTIIEKVRGLK